MPSIFEKLDKVRPFYDVVDRVLLVLCKLLLIGDIVITSYQVLGRYCSFIPDPAWTEETILTLMAYMAVLSAALAIRRNAHIRMTALDRYLPDGLVKALDILSDVAVLILAVVMLTEGWTYAREIGSKGTYVSMTWLSRFWKYFPVCLAGVFMIVFEIEALYTHVKSLFVKGGEEA